MHRRLSKIRVRLDRAADRSHDIVFDRLDELARHMSAAGLRPGRCVVVTDANVGHLYGGRVEQSLKEAGWQCTVITLPPGERTKSLDRLSEIIDAVLGFGIDRRSPVIALGGGVIGDLAGFAAASLLRGIPLVHVPTSLVAQVDSAIGGKTGINHETGKNLIGAFHQPSLVLVDVATLSTLPDSEWMSGLSEVAKYALIRDAELLADIRTSWEAIMERDPETVSQIVSRCAAIKAAIVEVDERESGERAILNFGHTFGHALETVAGYSGVTHGIGVAAGMRAAIHLSTLRFPEEDFSEALELTDRLPQPQIESDLDPAALFAAMRSDKKRIGEGLRFVLLERVGSAVVVGDVSEAEIRAGWEFSIGPFKSGDRTMDS